MDTYAIWFDLAPGARDLELVDAMNGWLGALRDLGTVESWTLERRKFGFGPDGLGEFHVRIHFRDLAQLDEAFQVAAVRDGSKERLHIEVFSRVTNFRSGLYRPFPDPQRVRPLERPVD